MPRILQTAGALLILGSALVLAGCASTPSAAPRLATLERERLLGTWHIIANVPYFAEKGKVATRVEYVERADGRLDDLFYFRESMDAPEERWEGVAWALDDTGTRYRARFIWPFSTEFWVIHMNDDGQIALIATPDAKLAWVYARTPKIDEARYSAAVEKLADYGVDTSTLVRIPQP